MVARMQMDTEEGMQDLLPTSAISVRMRSTAEDLIIEIINGDEKALPQGETGGIAAMYFTTNEIPFIRYRIGDFGFLCDEFWSCGRELPLLKKIQDRSTYLMSLMMKRLCMDWP